MKTLQDPPSSLEKSRWRVAQLAATIAAGNPKGPDQISICEYPSDYTITDQPII